MERIDSAGRRKEMSQVQQSVLTPLLEVFGICSMRRRSETGISGYQARMHWGFDCIFCMTYCRDSRARPGASLIERLHLYLGTRWIPVPQSKRKSLRPKPELPPGNLRCRYDAPQPIAPAQPTDARASASDVVGLAQVFWIGQKRIDNFNPVQRLACLKIFGQKKTARCGLGCRDDQRIPIS